MKIASRLSILLLTLLSLEVPLHVLAVHFVKMISNEEYAHRKLHQPGYSLSLYNPKAARRPYMMQLDLVFDPSDDSIFKFQGYCHGPSRYQASASGPGSPNPAHVNKYPLFPLDEASRNKMLKRPPPEVVAENIRLATGGELDNVDDLVEWVMDCLVRLDTARRKLRADWTGEDTWKVEESYNLGGLIPHGDDVLALLATNFHMPTAGVMVSPPSPLICRYAYAGQGGWWPTGMLVSQDEQRAILASVLYLVGDWQYMSRRYYDLYLAFQGAQGLGQGQRLDGYNTSTIEPQKTRLSQWGGNAEEYFRLQFREAAGLAHEDGRERRRLDFLRRSMEKKQEVFETCMQRTETGTDIFLEEVEALNKEILLGEEEWVSRYLALVEVLRADLYDMAPRFQWSMLEKDFEEIVDASEEMAGETLENTVDCLLGLLEEEYGDSFQRFLAGEIERIREKYWPMKLTDPVVKRIAYWRWRLMG